MKSFYILLFSIAILSCQKEKTSLPIEENSIAISSQLKTNKLQTFEFVLKNDTLISGKEGTSIWITKDLFENYTNGKITFELKEFYSKEDMILNPNEYTVWFKIIFDEFYHYLEDHKL